MGGAGGSPAAASQAEAVITASRSEDRRWGSERAISINCTGQRAARASGFTSQRASLASQKHALGAATRAGSAPAALKSAGTHTDTRPSIDSDELSPGWMILCSCSGRCAGVGAMGSERALSPSILGDPGLALQDSTRIAAAGQLAGPQRRSCPLQIAASRLSHHLDLHPAFFGIRHARIANSSRRSSLSIVAAATAAPSLAASRG